MCVRAACGVWCVCMRESVCVCVCVCVWKIPVHVWCSWRWVGAKDFVLLCASIYKPVELCVRDLMVYYNPVTIRMTCIR